MNKRYVIQLSTGEQYFADLKQRRFVTFPFIPQRGGGVIEVETLETDAHISSLNMSQRRMIAIEHIVWVQDTRDPYG